MLKRTNKTLTVAELNSLLWYRFTKVIYNLSAICIAIYCVYSVTNTLERGYFICVNTSLVELGTSYTDEHPNYYSNNISGVGRLKVRSELQMFEIGRNIVTTEQLTDLKKTCRKNTIGFIGSNVFDKIVMSIATVGLLSIVYFMNVLLFYYIYFGTFKPDKE